MNKPTVVEIPPNATEQVVRIQIDAIAEAVRAARPERTEGIVVSIQPRE